MRTLLNVTKIFDEQRYEYNIIFTHSHMDHILGFPFFKPIYNEKAVINLMGCPTTQGDISKLLSRAMSAPFFPVQFDKLKAKINYTADCPICFRIDSIEIFPINLSHPNVGIGYKFIEDEKTFVFLTDNELGYRHKNGMSFDEYADFTKDADLLIHDSEYTPEQYKSVKTWGHSHYVDALNLAFTARVKRLGLFHHNQDRSDADQDLIVKKCRDIIKSKNRNMECFALTQTTELTL